MDTIRLVLIEDNSTDSVLIEKILLKGDYKTELSTFTCFKSFAANWIPHETDLVITDHQIHDATSFEVVECVRSHSNDIPIIVLSGSLEDKEIARLILDVRVNDIILKSDLNRLRVSILKELQAKKSFQILEQQKQDLKMLSLVAEHTHNGVVVTNCKGEIGWVNKAFTTITGYSKEESIGKVPTSILEGPKTCIQTMKRIRHNLKKKIHFSEEILNYRKDGSEFWIKLDITPIVEDGVHTGFVAIQENITKRKLVQNQIKESEDRLDAAIHGADLGVWDLDVETGENFVNDKWYAMFGYEEGEIETNLESFMCLVHPDDAHIVDETFKKLIEGENNFDITLRCLHKDGDYRVIRDRGRVIQRDATQNIQRLIGTHLDITNETKLQNELSSSLTEKTILLQEIHHRVKNNLAIITGLLHLQSFSTDNEEVETFYSDMITRIKTIADVHELLYNNDSFTKINLHEYIASLVTNIKSLFKIQITPDINIVIDKFFEININQAIPIGLLLNELLTNSMKHAFDDDTEPTITLRISRRDEQIYCNYKDNGKGFDVISIGESGSLGFTLIKTLLQQLESTFEYTKDGGFGINFSFKVKHKGAHSNLPVTH
ncbi:MAG: PAS domain S-box protein [Balneolaceae bacterium]|nr:PAS domain S-box protein [Balneolaceae bacterium]